MNITTLIPAYKPKYIPELLSSLRYQTRPSQRILISDDSPNGAFREVLFSERMKPLTAGLNIELIEGPRTGAYENIKHLLQQWNNSSELVHLHLDDDVCYPDFYERHLIVHASAPVSCSISRRWTASESGQPLTGQPAPLGVNRDGQRLVTLDNNVVVMSTVAECKNWFGEFSNCVMRADTCKLLLSPTLGGVSYAGLWDLGYFVAASQQAPIGYIQDHLGYFRTGSTGNSSNFFGPFMKGAVLGYAALALGCKRAGTLSPEQAHAAFKIIAGALNTRYISQEDMQPFCKILPEMVNAEPGAEERFVAAWTVFQQANGF
jgi:hypothetical protein